jgi:PAS domain S-box-containing protein
MANGNGAKNKRPLVKGGEAMPASKAGTAVLEAERERVEQVWAEAEHYKTALLNSVSEIVVFQDLEHRVLWANKVGGESVGIDTEELVGRYCYDVWGRVGKACPGCPVDKAHQTGKPQAGEMTTPDGKVWLIKGYPILNASGDVSVLVEMALEITERKKAEEKLQAERNKLQSVISAMEDGLNIMDKDYNIIYQSRLPRKLYGDHLGEKCYRVYAGSEEICDGCPVKKAFKDGKSHTSGKALMSPSGELTYWETTANPVRDAEGNIVSCLEIARNITKHKRAEEELQAERNKLQSVIGAMEDGVTIQDRDFNILFQNEPLAKNYGGHIGEKCYRVYEGRDTICDGCPAKKAFKDGKSHTSDRKVTLPSGEIAFGENTASPIRDAEGNIVSCVEIVRDVTKRKRVEEQLQTERNKLQSIVDSLEYGITIQDRDFNILFQNEQGKKPFGEHIGEKCYRVYAGKEQVCDGCPVAKAFKDGESHTTVRKNFLPSGELAYWENTASPIRDAKGNVVSCLEITRNITVRKQVEDELQEERNKLQSLIGAMEFSLSIQDRDFKIIYQNEASQKTSAGSRVDEKCYRVYEDKDAICDGCPVAKAFKDGRSHTAERQRTEPSGKVSYWENTASPIRDAKGNIVSCLEIGVEITERKKAEEDLRESEARYRAVVEGAYDMIQSVDFDGRILFVNKAWLDTLGYTEAELADLNLFDIIHPDSEAHCREMFKKVVKGQSVRVEEVVLLSKDGRKVLIEGSAVPRYIGDRVVATHGIFRDITEHRRAEEALANEAIRHRILIDESSDGIVVLDEKGKVYEANKRFAEMLGYTYEEAQKLSVWDWEYLFPREQVAEMIRTVDERGDHFETKHRRKDGSTFDVEISTNGAVVSGQKLIFCVCRDITERKQAEEELRQSEARLAEAQRLAHIGSWELDIASNTLTWSDEVYRIFGLKLQQFGATYEAFLDGIHPGDREIVNKAYTESVKTKTPYSIVHRLLLKDGAVKYVNETGETFYDDEGEPVRSIGTVQDITERKQAEAALVEAEKKYKNLVEVTSDLIWEADSEGMYTFVSPNIKDLLGYEVEEVVGKKRTLDLAPKKEVRKWLERFKSVNAKRESFSGFEVVHHHKDGRLLTFEVSGVPVFDRAGNFKGYVGINKNITERKHMTEALKESQKFSTGLMENSPNPKSVLNPDTSIRYVNPAFEKLTGYKMSEVVGMKAPYPWWPKADRERMAQALKNAMASGGKKSEHIFRKKNGEPFWVMLNSGSVIHRKKLLYFLISWLDITDRKRADEERAELEQKAHLASRLASVGEMASGIAHEINNPLTAVIGFAQLLMDNDLPEEIKEDLVIIHKEAQRAAGVARNLLTFARKHAPSKQPTNINSIIEGVLTLRAYEQNVSNIQIVTKLAQELPDVLADYSQLQQVFINIILNAEAAMLDANNGGTLTITTQKFNSSVRASFADNGPGISKENLNRIFDPFFTTKEVGKGTGLGLSVCHGIIAEHGGRIYARSKPGSGATFIIELPISSHEEVEETNEAAKGPEQANPDS